MANKSSEFETYYVPEQSKLAFFTALGLFLTVYGLGSILDEIKADVDGNGTFVFILGFIVFGVTLFSWFYTTIKENMQGLNSAQLKVSYVMGMKWFIFSEVMFFFAFFGALFYLRTLAGPWLSGEGDNGVSNMLWEGFVYEWPMLITPQDALKASGGEQVVPMMAGSGADQSMAFPGWDNITHWLPLWNTIILLSSSFTLHVSHHALKEGNKAKMKLWLGITVALGIFFLFLQYKEYEEALYEMGLTLGSGVYGSTFFLLTGFHGFHVCMGAFMLLVMFLRATMRDHFTPEDHFGFEAAAWYWHFVDVVWLFLFLFVYIF